jgi:hypothetical protein
MSLLGISLVGMSLFGMSLGGSGLPGGWLEPGVVAGTLPAGELLGELFPGGQGLTAVALPPGSVGDVTLGFKDRFDVEVWFPTPPPVVAGVPAPTLVDELPPELADEGLADEGLVDEPGLVALAAAVPLLVTVGFVVVLSHGTTTDPALPATLPALPATAGVP